MKYNKKAIIISVVGALLLLYAIIFHQPQTTTQNTQYIHNEGKAQGTYYSATYLQPDGKNLQADIEKLFNDFDMSLSTYNPNSIISQINRNVDSVQTDSYFETMYRAAHEVSVNSNGAFDITVAPLVNAWGFGFGNKERKEQPDIEKIIGLIGYEKIKLINHKLIKDDPKIMLDASGLAQGLSADLIAQLFEKQGCENYMIDIGGEIVCKGKNPKNKNWQIGIDKPIEDPVNNSGELQTIISISNVGLTTSGNYRQFYYRDGKKYSHTIDPRTSKPVDHNLLSATVVAPNCIMADAYATACMVLGVDSALLLIESLPNIDCYLVYTDDKSEVKIVNTKGFEKYLRQDD